MKTKFLVSLILLTVTGVQAQNTAQATQFRADMCDLVATRGAYSYKFKERGLPPISLNTVPETAVKSLTIWAITYGHDEATSVDNAYRVSLAKCMDNIDRVYRDDRMGRQTSINELQ